jgi:hypothetical protein
MRKLQVLGSLLGILETNLIRVKSCLLHACTVDQELAQEKNYGVASTARRAATSQIQDSARVDQKIPSLGKFAQSR